MLRRLAMRFTKTARILSRPQLVIALITILLVLAPTQVNQSPVAVHKNNKVVVVQTKQAVYAASTIKNTPTTPPTSSGPASVRVPSHSSSKSTPAASSLDFTLSTTNVNMSPGETTPTITATTTNGAAVSWLIVAPPSAQSFMLIKSGIVGYGESSHSFTIGSNATETAPGAYTATVTAYYASSGLNAGVTKNLTITIAPGATFQIGSYTGPFIAGTGSETCAPFTVSWTLPPNTTALPLTFTAHVTSSIPDGADTISGVQLNGNTGCVMIDDNSVVAGGVTISVYATDGVYSSSASLNYNLN